MVLETEKIYQGDCIEVLKNMPDESIDCVVTSPPYWALRDYGTAEWEGGDENCEHSFSMGGIKKSGLNAKKDKFGYLDDTRKSQPNKQQYKSKCKDCGAIRKDSQLGLEETPEEFVANLVKVFSEVKRVLKSSGTCWLNLGDTYHNKSLAGIPWRVAFALQSDGWYLRQDIIWAKPNPMPESVQDRCTKSHEYIFLLTKSPKYFYDADAVKEKTQAKVIEPRMLEEKREIYKKKYKDNQGVLRTMTRNKRSVWRMNTASLKDAHFAVFPIELPTYCIKAGCPEGGIVLDPFFGSGTTGLAAQEHNRHWVGIELNEEYIEIAHRRLAQKTLFV